MVLGHSAALENCYYLTPSEFDLTTFFFNLVSNHNEVQREVFLSPFNSLLSFLLPVAYHREAFYFCWRRSDQV